MLEYTIDLNPTITVDINTNETAVNVTTWKIINGVRSSAVSMTINTATQIPSNPGRWDWYAGGAFVTKPTTDINLYETLFKGVKYGQGISVKWKWYEEITNFSGRVYLDLTGGGTPLSSNLPYTGTIVRPVSNLADALIVAARIGTLEIWVKGNLALDRAVTGYKFYAIRGVLNDSIALANQNTNLCTFSNMKITGAWNGDSVYCDTCVLQGTTNFNGYGKLTIFMDSVSIKNGGSLQGDNCRFVSYTYGTCTIDFQNSATNFMAVSLAAGLVTLVNIAGATCYISGDVVKTLTTSIVAGTLVFSGTGHRAGSVGGSFVLIDECTWAVFSGPTPVLVLIDYCNPSAVADIYTANHQDAGTLGKALTDTLAKTLTQQQVRDAMLSDPSHWYLPSRDDLSLIYTNLVVPTIIDLLGNVYWSSSEYDATNAYAVDMSNGTVSYDLKNATKYCLPVHTFISDEYFPIGNLMPNGFYIFNRTGSGPYTYYEIYNYYSYADQWSAVNDIAIGTTSTAAGTGELNSKMMIKQGWEQQAYGGAISDCYGLPPISGSYYGIDYKVDFTITTNIISALWGKVVDRTKTFGQTMRTLRAFIAGKATAPNIGVTGTQTFRNEADDYDQLSATVDINGNRTNITEAD